MITQTHSKRNQKRRGRPATGKTPRVSYRFNRDTRAMLTAIALRMQCNHTDALRFLIEKEYNKKRASTLQRVARSAE